MIEITGIEHKLNSKFSCDIRRLNEDEIRLIYKDKGYTVIELKNDATIYIEESIKTLDARIKFASSEAHE